MLFLMLKNKKPVKCEVFYRDGSLKARYYKLRGQIHGKYEKWNDDGEKIFEQNCVYMVNLMENKFIGGQTLENHLKKIT